MKLVHGLIFLGFLQSVACQMVDQQVQALSEVKMMLNDSRGVLEEWKDHLDTACSAIATVLCAGGQVVQISLSSSGLSGVLSPSIAKLKTLQRLFLDGNDISGGIPQEIGNLSSLIILRLENNLFNGSIPDPLGRLSKLQHLDLSQNLLSGNIPISLSNIPSLNSINLAYNNLSGEIPELLHAALYNYTGNHLNCGPHSMPCEGNINNTGGSRKSTIKVVLGSIGGAIVLVLVAILILRRMHSRHYLCFDVPDEHALSLDLGQTQQFSFHHLMIATGNFGRENFIGKGSLTEVYKGVLPGQDDKAVAVKRFVKIKKHEDDMAFRREAEVIRVAVHNNILRLTGYCMERKERLLVYPFMENLSLSSNLEGLKPNQPTLDWAKRMKIALGVAHALEYLHDNCNPPIIHRDIKAANVLLNGNFEAVLGDFGLAMIMDQGKAIVTTEIQGTVGYMAPEYRSTGKASTKTDVYGYGVLLLEIVTGKGPDFHVNVKHFMQEGQPQEIVDPNLDRAYQREELIQLMNISLLCTQEEAELRPTMSRIVKMLEADARQDRWAESLHAQLISRGWLEQYEERAIQKFAGNAFAPSPDS
ncbi:LRR receptor kinase SERK2-like isoform X1 [Hordeum vulgare subsp. vulgare]|uniref:non-specific serine/threonine protein kinase n=2 Tax=Hordeum vulgare subsp. vulgare TaxID=112509 RepID=A0A8I6Y7K1_HORVV|nr:LRR receptor kinase SERK2-like isoform X1 [Hordeum vulgare subsp. vulgare]XP_044961177.1 LRR receptor kinase SERK2-like isoform X1 [Hordeum vulgare subsp. vulgare]XP_044961178.1 LRR receptor kinase SERK2-like isoform X1 [Hordeum vulgare subsp. vulgare]